LATLERIRKQQRDQERRKMADVSNAARIACDRVEKLKQRVAASLGQALAAQSTGAINMEAIRQHSQHRAALRAKINEGQVVVMARNKEVEEQRKLLVEASRRLKVIEKLRERKWSEYQAELRKEESEELDEAAVTAFTWHKHEEDAQES
jgi:flagellar FliJ protein